MSNFKLNVNLYENLLAPWTSFYIKFHSNFQTFIGNFEHFHRMKQNPIKIVYYFLYFTWLNLCLTIRAPDIYYFCFLIALNI